MKSTWDVVIVGAGHNGLVAAAYLAKNGHKVAVIERREVIGGCASTVIALGTKVNICNCDHSMIFGSGIIEELNLEDAGLKYVMLDPVKQLRLFSDEPSLGSGDLRKSWWLHRDAERTIESIARAHPGAQVEYRRYLDEMLPLAKQFLELSNAPPSFVGSLIRGSRRPTQTARLVNLARLSVGDVLKERFGSELLRAPAAASVAVWGKSPLQKGTGLGALSYALGHVLPTGRPIGGSGALCDALLRVFLQAEGRIYLGLEVESIRSDNTRVRSVTLSNGDEMTAKVVIATGNPRTTIVSNISSTSRRVARYRARWSKELSPGGYESKIDAVVEHLPCFDNECDDLEITSNSGGNAATTTLITPNTAAIHEAYLAALKGKIASRPIFLANVPDIADPTFRPIGGGHTFSLEVLYTPYELHGGWDETREPKRWLEAFSSQTSNDFVSGVKRWRVVSPKDYERDFSLTRGYAPSFGGTPLDVLLGLPRDLARYETPIDGLYFAGAGTFPGAGIWGASGRNVAKIVSRHLKCHKK